MPTYTIYGSAAGQTIQSTNVTYETARAGSALLVYGTTTTDIGQNGPPSGYNCYEGFLEFDTSTVVGTITSVTLSLFGLGNAGGDVEVRTHDWGAALTTSDWVAGADLGSKILLASRGSGDWPTYVYNTLTSEPVFLSGINQSGFTRMVVCSSHHRLGDVPPAYNDYIQYASGGSDEGARPKLVIETSEALEPGSGDVYWSSPRHIVRFDSDGTVLGIRRPTQWDGVSYFGYDRYQGASTCGSDGRVYSLCEVYPEFPPDDAWGEIYEDDLDFDGYWGDGAALPENDISLIYDVVTDWSDGTFWIVGYSGGFNDDGDTAFSYNCWHIDAEGTVLSRHYLDVTGDDDVYHAAMPRGSTSLYFTAGDNVIGKFDTVTTVQSIFHTFGGGNGILALAAAQDGTVYAWYDPEDAAIVFDSSGTQVDSYNYDNGDWHGSAVPSGPLLRLALDLDETHLFVGASGDYDSIWRIDRVTREGNQEPWVTLQGVLDSIGQGVDYGATTGLWMGLEPEPEPEPACPPPSNDNWANARVLVGNSGTVHGNNTCATLEPEEPSVSCSGDGERN